MILNVKTAAEGTHFSAGRFDGNVPECACDTFAEMLRGLCYGGLAPIGAHLTFAGVPLSGLVLDLPAHDTRRAWVEWYRSFRTWGPRCKTALSGVLEVNVFELKGGVS